MRLYPLFLVLLLGGMAAPVAAQDAATFVPVPATPDQEAAAREWLGQNARPLPSLSPSEADLAPIVARLSGARIVGIGEATHGTHEDQAFKAELIRALVRAGQIRAIMLEANIAPSALLDRYVRFGEGDPAAALLDPSQFRNMQGDEFGALLLWLRAWNLAHPDAMVAIVGIDCQDGGRDADTALAFVARHDDAFTREIAAVMAPLRPANEGESFPKFARLLDTLPGPQRTEMMAAAERLQAWFASHEAAFAGDPDFVAAQDAAIAAAQGFFAFEHGIAAPDGIDELEYYGRRDRLMADNALRMQQRLGVGAVLWAHDSHVIDRLPDFMMAMGLNTVGTLLEQQMGSDYRTVGFLWSHGALRTTVTTADTPLNEVVPNDIDVPLRSDGAGTLGRLLGDALPNHASAWIDMDALRDEPTLGGFREASYMLPYAGWFVIPEQWMADYEQGAFPWTSAFDIMVWHRVVTPQHRWPR